MNTIVLGTAVFVGLVLFLSAAVLGIRSRLLPARALTVNIRGLRALPAMSGDTLLQALAGAGIEVPAACGGAGTCAQCRVRILAGAEQPLPTERSRLSPAELRHGMRLSCQRVLRGDIEIQLPDALLKAEHWDCELISSRSVAPLIRELVLKLPEQVLIESHPGSYVLVESPPYQADFRQVEPSAAHRAIWHRLQLGALVTGCDIATRRAYSLASRPQDGHDRLVLLVRLALPPPHLADLPPGVVSAYLFTRRVGERVRISGPFGEFAVRQSQREMLFIGGGVGMAPLRAMIADQLARQHSQRPMSFWYGARSRIELFYQDEFEALARQHPNFRYTVALSDPASDDHWQGERGFIHDVLFERYLAQHPNPEDCEYYLCGPPLMIKAVQAMLDSLGVGPERIFNDDFGSA